MKRALFHRPSGSRILAASALLFALFAVQAAYQFYHARRIHLDVDVDLANELAEATLVAEEAAPSAAGWPQWRGPHRDGVVAMPELLTVWPENGPPQRWRQPIGIGYSSFAVREGRLYSLFAEGDQEVVACWRIDDGKEVWRYALHASGEVKDYPGPRSTPTLDGDRLYAVSSGGKLVCLNASDGSLRWQKDLLHDLNASLPKWGVAFSPLIDGDLLFTNPGGNNNSSIAALHKLTGELVWKSLDEPAGYSSPVAVTIADTRQIIFFLAKSLVGVKAGSGELCWRYPWETPFDVNAATPLAFSARHGDRLLHYVFISSGYDQGCVLLKIASSPGGGFEARPVYRGNQMCSHFASPVRRGDYLYGIDEARLACLNLRTGKVQWTKAGTNKGSLLRVNDFLLVLGENGKLTLVEASPEGYKERAEARVLRDGRCWTMPVLADGLLLLRNERQMQCLDLRKQDGHEEKEQPRGQ